MGVLMSEKVALQHNVDYATCLGMVKEARGKGLTAPVILMGKAHSPLAYISSVHVSDSVAQVTITLYLHMGNRRRSRTHLKLARTASSS